MSDIVDIENGLPLDCAPAGAEARAFLAKLRGILTAIDCGELN